MTVSVVIIGAASSVTRSVVITLVASVFTVSLIFDSYTVVYLERRHGDVDRRFSRADGRFLGSLFAVGCHRTAAGRLPAEDDRHCRVDCCHRADSQYRHDFGYYSRCFL